MKNNYIKIGLGIAIGIILTPIIFYIYYFGSSSISDNANDWGTFGDFFGGVINPIIGLITLIITVYIALELSKLDDNRNEQSLNFERKRFLNELRESEYRKINNELQRLAVVVITPEAESETYKILNHCTYFVLYNSHLFPFLHGKECNDLIKYLDVLHTSFNKTSPQLPDDIRLANLDNCLKASFAFSKKLQLFIVEQLGVLDKKSF